MNSIHAASMILLQMKQEECAPKIYIIDTIERKKDFLQDTMGVVGSPLVGCSYHKTSKAFEVKVKIKGRTYRGGYHKCPMIAGLIYDQLVLSNGGLPSLGKKKRRLNFPIVSFYQSIRL